MEPEDSYLVVVSCAVCERLHAPEHVLASNPVCQECRGEPVDSAPAPPAD